MYSYLVENRRRIFKFFWHHKAELFTGALWKTVFRIARNKLFFSSSVSDQEYQANIAMLEKRPWNLHIELSNICNANCVFCAYQYQSRKGAIMTDAIFTKALDEYCAMGGGDLRFEVTVGDPLVDKQFLRRVKEARRRKQITTIETITNGILLRRFGLEQVLTSGLTRMVVSLAAFDEQTYQAIYRNKKYRQVRENIYELLRLNQELGEPVAITLAFRTNLTMAEALALPDYQPIRKLPHTVEFAPDFDSWMGTIKQEDLPKGMHIRPIPKIGKTPCFWLTEGLIVYSEGKIGLCGCRDFDANSDLIVGDIRNDKLLDVWQGGRVRKIWQDFAAGNHPNICQTCTNYEPRDVYRTKEGNVRRQLMETGYKQP